MDGILHSPANPPSVGVVEVYPSVPPAGLGRMVAPSGPENDGAEEGGETDATEEAE